MCCDPQSHSFLCEIPQRWATGHAAGVAAALAACHGVDVNGVDARSVNVRERTRQGAFVRPPAERLGEEAVTDSQRRVCV
jgi:hypothetical protein